MEKQSPVIHITNAVPADEICKRIGVKPRSIRLARERDIFPASWFKPLREICEAHGVDCPEHAFNWKTPSDAPTQGAA